jgi:3-hydroxymyristoyl/3-hydroxydecanoyl-(acyl carrier protein) dehydratase
VSVAAFAPRRRGDSTLFDVEVPADLVYFQGHFDGEPILAGVVQLDLLVLRTVAAVWPELERLRRITRLRFSVPIRPGDQLEMRLARPAAARVDFELRRGETRCSAGTLHFAAGGAG